MFVLYVKKQGYWFCVGEFGSKKRANETGRDMGKPSMVIAKTRSKSCYFPSYGKVWDDIESGLYDEDYGYGGIRFSG